MFRFNFKLWVSKYMLVIYMKYILKYINVNENKVSQQVRMNYGCFLDSYRFQ